jgi:drug/metabolite transporter (DMT)-like permease
VTPAAPSRTLADLFWRRPYALLLLSPLFWAGNLLIGRAYGTELPPFGLAFWRWIVALAFLLPFVWDGLRAHGKAMLRHWLIIAGCGLTGFAGYPVLNYVALHSTPAATASMLNSTLPLMVPLLAWGIAGEVPSARTIAGIAISFIGVGIIVSHGDWSVLSSFSVGLGEIIMLVAVACFALYCTLLRYRPAMLPDKLFLFATMAASAIALLPFAIWEAAIGGAFPVQPYALASLLFIGLFASLIGNAFWTQCVATLGPTLTGASFHLMAVYASVLAYVLLGEPISPFHLAGISLILIGFAVAILPPRIARPAPSVAEAVKCGSARTRVSMKPADKRREAPRCS